jgi:hypothetical protein
MANIVSTARFKTTLKKKIGKGSMKTNRAKTNKDKPIGQKCM